MVANTIDMNTGLGVLSPQALTDRLASDQPWTAEHVRELAAQLRAETELARDLAVLATRTAAQAEHDRDKAMAVTRATEAKLEKRISMERAMERLLMSARAHFPDDKSPPHLTLRYMEAEDGYQAAVIRTSDGGSVILSVRGRARELGNAFERLIVDFDARMERGT